jgi:hypothetical protein
LHHRGCLQRFRTRVQAAGIDHAAIDSVADKDIGDNGWRRLPEKTVERFSSRAPRHKDAEHYSNYDNHHANREKQLVLADRLRNVVVLFLGMLHRTSKSHQGVQDDERTSC